MSTEGEQNRTLATLSVGIAGTLLAVCTYNYLSATKERNHKLAELRDRMNKYLERKRVDKFVNEALAD